MLHTGDDRIRFAKIRLGMACRMRQGHKHLPVATAPFANVILDDGLSTREAMLIAKTLEDPFRRVTLLAMDRPVLHQNTIDDIREGVQLRTLRRLAAPNAAASSSPSRALCQTGWPLLVDSTRQHDRPAELVNKDPRGTYSRLPPPKGSKATGGGVSLRPHYEKIPPLPWTSLSPPFSVAN